MNKNNPLHRIYMLILAYKYTVFSVEKIRLNYYTVAISKPSGNKYVRFNVILRARNYYDRRKLKCQDVLKWT